MSQREGFTSGFLLGSLVGGAVGGVIGALVASRRTGGENDQDPLLMQSKRGEANPEASGNMESARRSLEEKISQLNMAIDDVRQQLGSVNGNAIEQERE